MMLKVNKFYKSQKNYIIDKQIGSGEDGIIYIVKDEDYKEYVIKKIFKETSEQKILKAIKECDNVNKILGYSKEYMAILLDYVNGVTLETFLSRQEPLLELNFWRLINQLVDALHCIHSLKYNHLDLHTNNIMIVKDDKTGMYDLVIIDFGKSQVIHTDKDKYKDIVCLFRVFSELYDKVSNRSKILEEVHKLVVLCTEKHQIFFTKGDLLEDDDRDKIDSIKKDITTHVSKNFIEFIEIFLNLCYGISKSKFFKNSKSKPKSKPKSKQKSKPKSKPKNINGV